MILLEVAQFNRCCTTVPPTELLKSQVACFICSFGSLPRRVFTLPEVEKISSKSNAQKTEFAFYCCRSGSRRVSFVYTNFTDKIRTINHECIRMKKKSIYNFETSFDTNVNKNK